MSSISSLQTPPGYPDFVKLDPKYTCCLCSRVLREAVQTTCGHRACETCLTQYFDGKDEPIPCPAQEEDCDPQYKNEIVPDRSVRREIRVLKVNCTYKHFGCKEQVQWKDLEGHAAQCKYRPAECPNKVYGCNLTISKALLEEHLAKECNFRLVSCRYCKSMVPLSKLEDHEINECNSAPLRCRYGCETNFSSRQELSQHLDVCPVKPLECKYKVIGCSFVGNEKEMMNHISHANDEHLEKITIYVRKMELESLTLKGHIQMVTSENDHLKKTVDQLSRDLQKVQTDSVTLKAQIEKLNKDNKDLKLKMVSMTERIIHLERKSEDMAKKDIVDKHDQDMRGLQSSMTQLRTSMANLERQNATRGPSGGGADADAVRRLDNHDTQLAQVDVQMAELDLRFQILETASYNGQLLWKLRDYNRRKADAVSGKTLSLYSQPFYTDRFGYKMCARVGKIPMEVTELDQYWSGRPIWEDQQLNF